MISNTKQAEVNNLFGHLERLSTHENAIQFMYMYSERKGEIGNRVIIDHKFKNINTRKYITLVESYRDYTNLKGHKLLASQWNSKYAIKGIE